MTISEVSFSDEKVSFELGDLYERKDDGSRRRHVFCYLMGIGSSSSTGCVSVMVNPTRKISEQEMVMLEAERLEREYQEKLAQVSYRVVAAFQDERALKAYRFLQQDLTWMRMYHIYELTRDDLGEKVNGLASKKDWTRFTRSVNHPEVSGDDSRHIVSKEKPPSSPMSLSEAQAFISGVADLWFKQKCVDDSNA